MILSGQIIFALIAVHLVTVIGFFTLKRIKVSEKFRSSHEHPANLGNTALQVGGQVIVPVTIVFSIVLLYISKNIPIGSQLFYSLPIILLFLTGIIDDYKPISAPVRLAIHFASAICITIMLYRLTGYQGLENITSVTGHIVPAIFMIITICWIINTTNFIDGMDLFLVVNVVPGSLLFAFLHLVSNDEIITSLIFLIFLASLAGFTWFNRPKASIYMGDAGALCIGALLGACGVYILAKYGSIAGFIPFAAILVDTTFTLLKIVSGGSNPFKSHSGHAYQIAAKNGKSENKIRSLYLLTSVINTFLAYLCFQYSHEIFWQILLGLIAFGLSTILFFYLRKSPAKTISKVGVDA